MSADVAWVREVVRAALAEDVGPGDVTTLWCVPADRRATAQVVAKADGTLSGLLPARETFAAVDREIGIEVVREDGEDVRVGDPVLRLHGPARGILTGERVALNFMQRMSGVATRTAAFVEAVRGTGARILDTRKTTPGLRALEREAVRHGGGTNHRFGLFDMVLIKENHVAAAGGITAAVHAVRERNLDGRPVEVETRHLAEVDEALAAGVDRILLDNMEPDALRAAVERCRAVARPPETEASGGVTLATVRAVAETGVDFVSVGGLTHSAPALDLSLLFEGA